MSSTVVLSIEGVLSTSKPGQRLLNNDTIESGRLFYEFLKPSARIILLSSERDDSMVRSWLVRERFNRYAGLHCYPGDNLDGYDSWKVQQIGWLISRGHHIGYYVDTSPGVVRDVMLQGVTSILLTYPAVYAGTGLRPNDRTYVGWEDLVETVEEQNMLRATVGVGGEDDGN